MAEITRVHGGVNAIELVGRDLEWLTFTFTANSSGLDLAAYEAADSDGIIHLTPGSDLEGLVRIVETVSTVTIVGEPTTLTVTLCTEGLGATTAELDTAIEAADLGSDNTATVVVASVVIDGVTFA